jgi:hypothetical protein
MSFPGQSPVQIARVTSCLDATEEELSALLGVKRWIRLPDVHFGPDGCGYHGRPAACVVDITLSGESIYTAFLRERGPGLHHCVENTCVETGDIVAALTEAAANGREVVQRGALPVGMEFAYVSAANAGVPYVKIAQLDPEIRQFFDLINQE